MPCILQLALHLLIVLTELPILTRLSGFLADDSNVLRCFLRFTPSMQTENVMTCGQHLVSYVTMFVNLMTFVVPFCCHLPAVLFTMLILIISWVPNAPTPSVLCIHLFVSFPLCSHIIM